MAVVRMTMEEARAKGEANRAKVDATTEADIARWNAEDGFDPNDTLKGLRRVYGPAEIRAKAGLTQVEMAARLTVPLKTWRNWEQGRTALNSAVRALLALVADDPPRAFKVLDGGFHEPVPPLPEDTALSEQPIVPSTAGPSVRGPVRCRITNPDDDRAKAG